VTGVVSPVLIGREQELTRLAAALARAAAGEPGVVLVAGEAGVGKSRLLQVAFDPATVGDGARVLSGGCVELGGEGLPFVPLVECLRALVRTTVPDELDGLLGPARSELGRFLPELSEPSAHDGPAPDRGTAQLFELILGVLGRLGRQRPLVLIFEDLHWADRSTLELVAFLVRQLQDAAVLLVLTYRSDEVDRRSALRPLLSGWERLRGVERLELGRFDQAEVTAQVTAILGRAPDPGLVDVVFDRSEGNAFFVEEVLRALNEGATAEDIAFSLRELLLARAERLSDSAQRVLRIAAVAGRTVSEALLAQVAREDGARLFDALREAVDSSLLVVDHTGRGYAFRHALTRDAVYQDLLPGERVQLHTAYAEALEREPGLAGDGSVAATLAAHWYAAHDLPRALVASVRAGREAMASYAPAEARRHLERALEVWYSVPDAERLTDADEVELSTLAGQAAAASGDDDRALALYELALARLDRTAHPERAALIAERRAFSLRMRGEDGAGIAVLEDALSWLSDEPSPARATVLATLAGSLMRLGDTRAPDVARAALDAARAADVRPQEASALVTLGATAGYLEDADEGERASREGLRIALQISDHDEALRAYANLSDLLEARGAHQAAADTAREGLELAERVGRRRSVGVFLIGNLVEPLLRLGEWDEVEELIRQTLPLASGGVFSASLLEVLGQLMTYRGNPDEAADCVRQARRHLGASREPQFTHSLAHIEAEAHRLRGDLAAAASAVVDGLHHLSVTWSVRYAWPLIWLGRRIEADQAIRARDRGDAAPQPFMDGVAPPAIGQLPAAGAYRAMAVAEQHRRDGAAGVDQWATSVEAWEATGDVWPLAYARFRLAEALCSDGAVRPAAEPLRAAAATAERLAARPLLDDVRALARRARIPLDAAAPVPVDEPPETSPTPFGLTEREHEVLALLAAGRSNGQIARELFISPKTASVHVSNILAKLGVGGRIEAAAVAHRLGLVPADQ
jgi:DNA-binding CsgD family transcriptional regulator/tetratricopeptide (TPR) repeat protein